jgi:arginase
MLQLTILTILNMSRVIKTFIAECNQGQVKKGVAYSGYTLIKKLGLEYDVISNGEFDNMFYGINRLHTKLNQVNKNNLSLVIGGDHSIGAGSVQSSIDKFGDDLIVVWIDAHADINTKETSDTGNFHGMPVSSLLNINNSSLITSNRYLLPNQLIYVGLRAVDDKEKDMINDLEIEAYYMDEIKEKTIEYVISRLKERFQHQKIHVSFDVDGVDPHFLPSTGTPVNNGLTLNDMLKLANLVNSNIDNLVCLDVVEINIDIGDNKLANKTLDNTTVIIKTMLKGIL